MSSFEDGRIDLDSYVKIMSKLTEIETLFRERTTTILNAIESQNNRIKDLEIWRRDMQSEFAALKTRVAVWVTLLVIVLSSVVSVIVSGLGGKLFR